MTGADGIAIRRRMSSAETAARFLAESRRRPGPKPRRAEPKYVAPTTTVIAKAWREYVLTHLRERVARLPHEIHRDIVDDYGSVSLRSVERALRRMLNDGVVKRVDGGYVRCR